MRTEVVHDLSDRRVHEAAHDGHLDRWDLPARHGQDGAHHARGGAQELSNRGECFAAGLTRPAIRRAFGAGVVRVCDVVSEVGGDVQNLRSAVLGLAVRLANRIIPHGGAHLVKRVADLGIDWGGLE